MSLPPVAFLGLGEAEDKEQGSHTRSEMWTAWKMGQGKTNQLYPPPGCTRGGRAQGPSGVLGEGARAGGSDVSSSPANLTLPTAAATGAHPTVSGATGTGGREVPTNDFSPELFTTA